MRCSASELDEPVTAYKVLMKAGCAMGRHYAQPYRWFKAKTRLTNIKSMDDPSSAKIVANFKPITAV